MYMYTSRLSRDLFPRKVDNVLGSDSVRRVAWNGSRLAPRNLLLCLRGVTFSTSSGHCDTPRRSVRSATWNGSRDRGYSYQPPPAENVGVTFKAPGKLPCCHSGLALLVTAVACREKLRFSALDLSKAVKRTWPVIHTYMYGTWRSDTSRSTARSNPLELVCAQEPI